MVRRVADDTPHRGRWWEIDASYWVIRALELFGLAWNVKLPSKQSIVRAQNI